MDAHLTRAWTPSMTREVQADLLAALLFSSIPFNVLDAPAWRHFLGKWVRGLRAFPDRKTMRGPVLQRLLDAALATSTKIYLKGAFVTVSFDGWKSRNDRRLMGMVCTNVGVTDGLVSSDFRGTVNITGLPETAALMKGAVDEYLGRARAANQFALPQLTGKRLDTCPSMVLGKVSDSASSNVLSKNDLAAANASVILVARFPPQFNLVTGGILTHPSIAPFVTKMIMVVGWFKSSSIFLRLLELLMVKRLAFVTKGGLGGTPTTAWRAGFWSSSRRSTSSLHSTARTRRCRLPISVAPSLTSCAAAASGQWCGWSARCCFRS